jgi:DNA-binding CsgD family transcriptional regulator
MGAATRGRQIGVSVITSDLAYGEALAFACRRRGVDIEVFDPMSARAVLRQVVVLDLGPADAAVHELPGAIDLSGRRVIAVGVERPSPNGLTVDRFLPTTSSVDDLVDAITGAAAAPRGAATATRGPVAVLTPRERDVLAELLAGRDADAMSERLGVSANTARTHVQNIMSKLGVNSRSEAAAWALRAGITPAGEHVRALS